MISVAPMNPGVAPRVGCGNSSIVPIRFANVLRNSPSAGSSGITTIRGVVCGTPAASASVGRMTPAAGCVPEVRSLSTSPTTVPRSSAGSIRSASL